MPPNLSQTHETVNMNLNDMHFNKEWTPTKSLLDIVWIILCLVGVQKGGEIGRTNRDTPILKFGHHSRVV